MGERGALFAVAKTVVTTVMVIISSTFVFLQFTLCSFYGLQLIANMLFGVIFAQQL